MKKICQGCRRQFECLGTEQCWCNSFVLEKDKLEKLKTCSDDCFCKECLLSKNNDKYIQN